MAYSIKILLHVLRGLGKSPKQDKKDDDDTYIKQIEHHFTSPAPTDLAGATLEKFYS
jgi:hypothetical protein